MLVNKLVLSGALSLTLFLSGLPSAAQARDLSTLQTALQMSRDEMDAAEAERNVDAQHLAAIEKEMERLRRQLDTARKKAAESDKRYLESKKRYAKSQAAFDRAWKQ